MPLPAVLAGRLRESTRLVGCVWGAGVGWRRGSALVTDLEFVRSASVRTSQGLERVVVRHGLREGPRDVPRKFPGMSD